LIIAQQPSNNNIPRLRESHSASHRTSIGKDAAERHTYSYQGFSLLAERGLFGRVVKGGRVKVGDSVELLEDYKEEK
jgi:MOSC domain-containing protein YiiM